MRWALLFLSAAFSSEAAAYTCIAVPGSSTPLTQAWNDRCIPYYINNRSALLSTEAQRALVAQSFRVWSANNCTDLTFEDFGYTDQESGFDPNRGDNQNIIAVVEDQTTLDATFDSPELLAITLTAFSRTTGEIFDADVLVNGVRFRFAEVTDRASCLTMIPLPYDFRNTLVHELGHFIGFDHPPEEDSTMFASATPCETKKRDLTADDIRGICDVYGAAQPTKTCAPPADYNAGPGNPSRFRNQCDPGSGGDSPCSCSSTRRDGSPFFVAMLLGVLLLRRRIS